MNQIANKPAKIARYTKYNIPKKRKHGKSIKKCNRCGRTGAHISKYSIELCRQCFRELATNLGFKKYS